MTAAIPPAKLKHWAIRGKFAVRSPEKNGSGLIYWRQANKDYQVRLSSPLGNPFLSAAGDDKLITVTQGETQRTLTPASFNQQMEFPIPLTELPYWMKGLPAPGSDSIALTGTDNKHSFAQSDWTLSISRYQQVNGTLLPGKVLLSRGPYRLTVIIKQWELNPDRNNDDYSHSDDDDDF